MYYSKQTEPKILGMSPRHLYFLEAPQMILKSREGQQPLNYWLLLIALTHFFLIRESDKRTMFASSVQGHLGSFSSWTASAYKEDSLHCTQCIGKTMYSNLPPSLTKLPTANRSTTGSKLGCFLPTVSKRMHGKFVGKALQQIFFF